MKRIRIFVAYDGTNYCGWQVQPNGVTIEEKLNKSLARLTGEEIRIIGAEKLGFTGRMEGISVYATVLIQMA